MIFPYATVQRAEPVYNIQEHCIIYIIKIGRCLSVWPLLQPSCSSQHKAAGPAQLGRPSSEIW